jgi:hypothetical protein
MSRVKQIRLLLSPIYGLLLKVALSLVTAGMKICASVAFPSRRFHLAEFDALAQPPPLAFVHHPL